jgi:phosphatidylserine/phosphatidylglycerophosphate/cardiolipin synthase-like enzyme
MSQVRVAVPVTRRRILIHVDKGQPWSIVEHLILEAIAGGTRLVSELETGFNLPRRVVIEAVIRLMRAGWVDMRQQEARFVLAVTSHGARALERDELPSIERRISRPVVYLCDRVAGHIFRSRELRHFDEKRLRERAEKEDIRWLPSRLSEGEVRYSEFPDVVLDHDERWGGAELAGESSTDRYALFGVIDGVVEGLPDRELPDLRNAILAAAARPPGDTGSISATFEFHGRDEGGATNLPLSHGIAFEADDLILDGDAHRRTFERVLKSAISRIVIHSTFISEAAFFGFLPLMVEAAVDRGVMIDVLWGQNEEADDPERSAAILVSKIAEDHRLRACQERLVLHRHSTRSHAKVLLADLEEEGRFSAVIGSCNWLASGYDSLEASVLLREPAIVAEVVRVLVDLAQAHSGVLTPLASELFVMSEELRSYEATGIATSTASLVVGPEHNRLILQARDEAEQRILVTSHRLGRSGRPGVLIPLIEACRDGTVEARARYGRLHRIPAAEQSQWASDAEAMGVNLTPMAHPRLHAKVLAWDNNAAVVTSLNWLSADPSEFTIAKELGVFIESPGIAKAVFERFDSCA